MKKSPEAFRTISEVADWLGVPTHVLRFWESRFAQVKPVKRAGGRRYYRPNDMLLLGGIKRLLHDDGMTIRGVQKLLREEGIKHVMGFSQSLDDGPMIDVTPVDDAPMAVDVEPEDIAATVVPIKPASDEAPDEEPAPELAFLHRAAKGPAAPADSEASADDEAPASTPQADLFTSRRAPQPEAQDAAAPAIPATPGVPDADADDDDPRFPARPGPVVRLRLARSRLAGADSAVLSDAVSRLRDAREALAS